MQPCANNWEEICNMLIILIKWEKNHTQACYKAHQVNPYILMPFGAFLT